MTSQFMTTLLRQPSRDTEPRFENFKYHDNVDWWLKVDLFSLDKLVVPINLANNHWILACIFVCLEKIQIFDSIKPSSDKVCRRHNTFLQALLVYVQDEHEERQGYPLTNASKWTLIIDHISTAWQRNYFDCGIFTCMFAEYLAGKRTLNFTQSDATNHSKFIRYTLESIADR